MTTPTPQAGTIQVAPGSSGYRLTNGVFVRADQYIVRDFAFQWGRGVPVPCTEVRRVSDWGLIDTEFHVTVGRQRVAWYIIGVRAPVPCLDVTLWYDGKREVTIAPDSTATTYPIGPIAVMSDVPVAIRQTPGLHGRPMMDTHILTLTGLFLREELIDLLETYA
jgi:hypothetical protein